jgi:ABC-type transport system involved in multi-copper enzyme maturation permease subunit
VTTSAFSRQFRATARLEFADGLRSRWLLLATVADVLLVGVFVLAGMHESRVFGITGMSRVLFSFSHALVIVIPLMALATTGQVIGQARSSGTLEFLFSNPLSRTTYFLAVTSVRLLLLWGPLVLVFGVCALVASIYFREPLDFAFLIRTLAVCTAELIAFTGIGMLLSAVIRHPARTLVWILIVWATAIALLDLAMIGLLLQWRMDPQSVFLLAILNPVQDARLALLAGGDPELATLGPVGFFIVNRLGNSSLLVIGLVWPVVLGLACWWTGIRSFCRRDLL